MKKESRFYTTYNKIVFAAVSAITLLSFCYLDFVPPINKIVKILAVVINGILFLAYIVNRKYTKYAIILFIIFLVELIATLLSKNGDIVTFLELYGRILGYSMYLEKSFSKNPNSSVKTLYWILWVLVLINFMTIILFPNGLYFSARYSNNWFFMYDNTHIVWYIAALLICHIDAFINKKRMISAAILYIMVTYSVFYCMSSTSIVAYLVFLLYVIFHKTLYKVKTMNYKTYLLIFMVFNILFVFLRVQNIFSWFIVDVLGKSLTFTGRTIIWDKVMKFISLRPLIGYGMESAGVFTSKMNSIFFTHAHNTLLDISYKGGIISGVCFFVILLNIGKELKKCKYRKMVAFISIALLSCFIMMIFEAREEKIGLYIILTVASCVNYFKKIIPVKKTYAQKMKSKEFRNSNE